MDFSASLHMRWPDRNPFFCMLWQWTLSTSLQNYTKISYIIIYADPMWPDVTSQLQKFFCIFTGFIQANPQLRMTTEFSLSAKYIVTAQMYMWQPVFKCRRGWFSLSHSGLQPNFLPNNWQGRAVDAMHIWTKVTRIYAQLPRDPFEMRSPFAWLS